MKLHLFWIDKHWKNRGYAKNKNLIINMENRTYWEYTNPYTDYTKREDIEVKHASDITDYIAYLEENGFRPMKPE